MFNENQFSFDLGWNVTYEKEKTILKDLIVDRKSKYTIVVWKIENKEEIKAFIKELTRDKYFAKATHNSYAYIIKNENWSVIEWKNDDWEAWAWMCILREMKREDCQNMIIVVTRFFGWIHLMTDRFKNVIDATQITIEKIKNNEI